MTLTWNPRPKDELLRDLTLPKPLTTLHRAEAQALAEAIALRGVGRVAPNPLVGAVLVDAQHRFLAAGAHEKLGGPHAEISAFAALPSGQDAKGAILYVTLEPCAHQGLTPACAPEVAKRGVKTVVYGAVDPNPSVNGRGAAILAAAGVAVEHDRVWESRCAKLAEVFLWTVTRGTPFVGLKAATTLDGAIARPGDRRAWITGGRARAYGHFLRNYYDAIIVGQTTMISDDPTLDTREALVKGRTPLRVVLDPDGRALQTKAAKSWKILADAPQRVLWLHGAEVESAAKCLDGTGIQRAALGTYGYFALFDPHEILAVLAARGITSVLLEGGGGVYGSFLAARCVNKVHVFQAPKLFGGSDTLPWTGRAGALTGADLSDTEITPLGDDWLLEATLASREIRV